MAHTHILQGAELRGVRDAPPYSFGIQRSIKPSRRWFMAS